MTAAGARRRTRVLAVGGAVLAAVLVGLAAAVLGIELRVDMRNGQPPMVIGLPLVAGFALAFALLGWGALAVLERFSERAATIWTWLAVIVLLVSFVPILFAEATAGARTVLAAMHLAVAAVLVPLLRRRG
ncbi:DUF6069 family protein [Nonomuraea muscovyensis]|uniref:Lysylphosphatidylglycerol synthetase-like protein (DUF2156 family) n=1 Tax=Nonomuraea muscovyensis TaxID=1124761 RepID=A0A7X0C375_9ACTN|nr:DUF6069 family protein [Nonomuraea muscovyensis]MBB6346650.1 lysylphosphatidylglycerol synthetase-like protein (DUF2156 family) [Nonomuraea muscovyensis]